MAEIVLSHVEKVYADGVKAPGDLNLEVADGESIGHQASAAA